VVVGLAAGDTFWQHQRDLDSAYFSAPMADTTTHTCSVNHTGMQWKRHSVQQIIQQIPNTGVWNTATYTYYHVINNNS